MPKRVFWPAAFIVMGLVILASKLQLLPSALINLWPILLIIIGLGGLLTSDTDEWIGSSKRSTPRASVRTPARSAARKPAKKASRKK